MEHRLLLFLEWWVLLVLLHKQFFFCYISNLTNFLRNWQNLDKGKQKLNPRWLIGEIWTLRGKRDWTRVTKDIIESRPIFFFHGPCGETLFLNRLCGKKAVNHNQVMKSISNRKLNSIFSQISVKYKGKGIISFLSIASSNHKAPH